MTPITVLLVDDVQILRRLMRIGLSVEQGIEVIGECEDGAEAVVCAKKHQPEIVMLDLNMPRVNGLQALPKILEVSASSRVIVMSAFGAPQVEETARGLGASAYIEKGTDIKTIAHTIRQVARAS